MVEQEIVEQCMEREVTGLIITPTIHDDVDLSHLFELKRHNIPFVLLEDVRGVRASLVDVDNVIASYHAVKYLIEQGHSNIVHFGGPVYSQHSQERIEGVRRAFSESHNGVFGEPEVRFPGPGLRNGVTVFPRARH